MTTVGQESGTSCLKKQQHWFADNINEMQSIIDKNKDANQKTQSKMRLQEQSLLRPEV